MGFQCEALRGCRNSAERSPEFLAWIVLQFSHIEGASIITLGFVHAQGVYIGRGGGAAFKEKSTIRTSTHVLLTSQCHVPAAIRRMRQQPYHEQQCKLRASAGYAE